MSACEWCAEHTRSGKNHHHLVHCIGILNSGYERAWMWLEISVFGVAAMRVPS
jgi:hypothetical protein